MTSNTLEIIPVREYFPKLLLKTALFLISGTTLIAARHAFTSSFLRLWLLIGGIFCILVFLALLLRVWQNARLKGPILTLTPNGLRIGLGSRHSAFVTWYQICGFSLKTIGTNELLLIHLINPARAIKQVRNPFERLLLHLCMQVTGTPFAVRTSVLTYPSEELTALLHNWHSRYYECPSEDTAKPDSESQTPSQQH